MLVKIEQSWNKLLQEEFDKPYFEDLVKFIKEDKNKYAIFPPGNQIFNAFDQCSLEKVRVVIIGQDPYHGQGQAHGLSFSVNDGVKFPPSLRNIFKELKNDLGIDIPESGNLEKWARQGVLLLNATLTVRAGQAGSHQNKGWEEFTDSVIKKVSLKKENIVFILWGAFAQKKESIIDTKKHFIIKSPHPSPFSADRGFFGSKPFSKTNTYLRENNLTEINW